ncbi:MAG: 2-dehydro-3-deoxy-6-phosphogalactonate aldolase [Pseudomonadota bacterium]
MAQLKHRNIIAITRGIKPSEAAEVALAYMEAGITRIEVPLNSPDPFASISSMIDAVGSRALIGAGTVLNIGQVEELKAAGGQFVVSPNANPAVIAATKAGGMESWPGVMTPTECFSALDAGADGLKLFPANLIGPGGVKAMRAVLPKQVPLYAVGGVADANFAEYAQAGCNGFGLGSSLYKAGMLATEAGEKAAAAVEAHDAVFGPPA